MKKLICMILAIAMFICGSIPAFATNTMATSDNVRFAAAVQRISEQTGVPMKMVSGSVSETEDFIVYTTVVKPAVETRGLIDDGRAFQSWFDKKSDQFLGDIFVFGDFEYTGTSAKILNYSHEYQNKHEKCSYKVSTQGWGNTVGSVEKAYYRITYTFTYNGNTSPKTTLEVNCSKTGEIGGTGRIVYLE